MKTINQLKVALIIFALLFFPACGNAPIPEVKPFYILLDMSGSAAHIKNPTFAAKAAQQVVRQIKSLPLSTEVYLIPFGDFTLHNVYSYRLQKRPQNQTPQGVAKEVEWFISHLKGLIAKGTLRTENHTNLIGALIKLAPVPGSQMIILSDLEENTDFIVKKFLKSKGSFPGNPDLLKNISVTVLGFGLSMKSSEQYQNLEKLWREWFQIAGVSEVKLYSDSF